MTELKKVIKTIDELLKDSPVHNIKGCPCCGGKAQLEKPLDFIVECTFCYTRSFQYNSMYDAIEAWNKRPESDLEKIKKICEKIKDKHLDEPCYLRCPYKECVLDKINNILEGEKG